MIFCFLCRKKEQLVKTFFVSEATLRDYVAACDLGLIPYTIVAYLPSSLYWRK